MAAHIDDLGTTLGSLDRLMAADRAHQETLSA
jgi:hypothetical protein